MRTRILALVTLTVPALAVGAPALAGGGGYAGACQAFASGDSTEIVLQDNCFGPISATAAAGDTVTIRNEGNQRHTYTAVDRSFDTGVLEPGDSVTVELPDETGTLPVYCTLHADHRGNGMAGTVTLDVASGTSAAAGSPASLGSSGIALAGGFVLGSGAIAAVRKRRERSEPEPEWQP